ncbi:ATPase family AAA domain-containing protein 5 isoform X2 [Syngnathus scovelli]|uniref:ATPase family AAA domain-containing protein 5 isoform X2 n=1 Tax=Syngnathus scovelli TaxID=161590 RepID=UPI00211051FF|nr:ATPase family AAA domain-containing protein 5 isoform X2 [Syngnathus scovelli]
MAGVVAMASVIEDFDTQPCKKSSKDGGSAVVKTITSYFSPVAKVVEKPFSPPRSNNIMDYFSRAPLTSPSEHPKGNGQKSSEKHTSPDVGVNQLSRKRRRKTTKAARKLVDLETVISNDEASSFIVKESNLATDCQNVCAVLGSDTAALLAQISADAYSSNRSMESDTCQLVKQAQKDEPHKSASKCGKDAQPELDESINSASSPAVHAKNKVKTKAVHNSRKNKHKKENHFESELESAERSCAVHTEVNEDAESKSNTVMISFEDFLRSQSEVKGEEKRTGVQCEDKNIPQEADEMDTHQSDTSKPKADVPSTDGSLQVSPPTIFVQAQMHTISNPERSGALQMNRRKAANRPTKEASPPHTPSLTAKRKSNVVLEEEDLDLAVLGSESIPLRPDVERKQFLAAFKQPGLDGSKAKLAKNKAKQKQPIEKDEEENDFQENTMVIKSKRKCRKAAIKVTISIDGVQEEPDASSNPSIATLKRSQREGVVRPASKTSKTTSVSKVVDSLKDSHYLSPSKTQRKSKHGVYEVEIISPPDGEESPIRIKLRRLERNVSEGVKNPPLACHASASSTKHKKAKKLVAKAKAVQQIKKDAVESKSALRRSARTKASILTSYSEDEMEPQKSQTKTKSLRNLNEVLGKATKAPSASLAGLEKSARKSSSVISIFDESSQEGSENSQDDEQVRARREFLKSGLPESFKKQMAKAAATKETYTLSCASFQPVLHVMQIPTDCPLWSLPWPESPQLCHLNELSIQVPEPYLPLNGPLGIKTKAERGVFCQRGSGWRLEMSDNVRQLLMDEVVAANPLFPGETFLPRFLARRADHQHHLEAASIRASPEPVGGKRKRMDDKVAKVAKKQRAAFDDENTLEPKKGGRAKRAQRLRLTNKAKDKASSGDGDPRIALDDLCVETDKKVEAKEDVLWTEKYQPQCSGDIVGNKASVLKLHSWLKEWKLRADRDERNKQKEKTQEEGSIDSDWDCGDEDPLFAEDSLCNTVLITGPKGIGKTASVYACAQELAFKVFEVNASSQRSGRLILSQLKEATQSHQVDSQGVNANKPAYYSYGSSSSAGKHGSSPRKPNSPRKVVSSPRKAPNSPRGAKRGGPAPTTLANFFKMSRPAGKEAQSATRDEQKKVKPQEDTRKQKDSAVKSASASEEQSKRTATSLILFEEVDVIFDEDAGFLAAIKTFMSTTKRPVILTTSDPAFRTMFDGNFEEIHFKRPSLPDASSYLRLLCLAEDTRTDQRDVDALLRLNGCDIRQSLLQLQCWTRSAGGRPLASPSDNAGAYGNQPKGDTSGEAADTCPRPPRESGCTESRLGLLNIEPERDVWDLLRIETHKTALWELLMESTRQGVHLLYSNMETLLPLPHTTLIPTYKAETPSEITPSHARPPLTSESADCSDDDSPFKVPRGKKRNKKKRVLPDLDGLHSDSDSEESFLSLCKQQEGPQAKEEPTERLVPQTVKRKTLTPAEHLKSLPVSQCLQSISDFFDTMSDMDSALVHYGDGPHGGPSRVTAALKDGMTDESRVEPDTWSWAVGERALEIQSAVEALSFHKCRRSAAEAWERARRLEAQLARDAVAELTLPVAAHCQQYSFTQSNLCQPQIMQRRRDVMESLACSTFGALANRSATAVDYMPALRTICRSEKIKERGKVKRRFLHYLDSIHLGLHRNTLQYLSRDFP